MPEIARELVVLISHGMDDEQSPIALTIANGGMTAGFEYSSQVPQSILFASTQSTAWSFTLKSAGNIRCAEDGP
jgi:hypothetical protein